LERHRERMLIKLQELNDCLTCIEWKIEHYKEFETMAAVEEYELAGSLAR